MKAFNPVRIVITAIFLYFVFHETGPWTTASFFFVWTALEVIGWWMQKINGEIEKLKFNQVLPPHTKREL